MSAIDSADVGLERAGRAHHARRVRQHTTRHAERYDAASRVPQEIGRRLLEHLDPVRRDPSVVLDLEAATGHMRRALALRYPRARIISFDASPARLRRARHVAPRRLFTTPALACAEPVALPLPSASVDLVCCNLALTWCRDLPRALGECRRVLRDGGLVMLSTLGPDTLVELRTAWAEVDDHEHVLAFPDMHDLGDALSAARLADVVVDVERLRVEFDDLPHLLRETRDAGPGNPGPRRNPGLTAPSRMRRLSTAFDRQLSGRGCHASLEAVYAHAWAPAPCGVEVPVPTRGA